MSSRNSLNDFTAEEQRCLRVFLARCYKADVLKQHWIDEALFDVSPADAPPSLLFLHAQSIASDLVALGFLKAMRAKNVFRFAKVREIKAWLKGDAAPLPKKDGGLLPVEAAEVFATAVAAVTPPVPSYSEAPPIRKSLPLASLRWLQGIGEHFTHAKLRDGRLTLASYTTTLQVPFPHVFEVDVLPDLTRLLRVLRTFEKSEEVVFAVEDAHLVVSDGKASCKIPLLVEAPIFFDCDTAQALGAQASIAVILNAFRKLAPFCEPSNSRPFTGAVFTDGDLLTVCNGHTIAQIWLENFGAPKALVPLAALDTLTSLPGDVVHLQITSEVLTARASNGALLIARLYAADIFPDISPVWPQEAELEGKRRHAPTSPIADLAVAVKTLTALNSDDADRVRVAEGQIGTRNACVSVPNLAANGVYVSRPAFEKVLATATEVLFLDGSRCYFSNDGLCLRGMTYCAPA